MARTVLKSKNLEIDHCPANVRRVVKAKTKEVRRTAKAKAKALKDCFCFVCFTISRFQVQSVQEQRLRYVWFDFVLQTARGARRAHL